MESLRESTSLRIRQSVLNRPEFPQNMLIRLITPVRSVDKESFLCKLRFSVLLDVVFAFSSPFSSVQVFSESLPSSRCEVCICIQRKEKEKVLFRSCGSFFLIVFGNHPINRPAMNTLCVAAVLGILTNHIWTTTSGLQEKLVSR